MSMSMFMSMYEGGRYHRLLTGCSLVCGEKRKKKASASEQIRIDLAPVDSTIRKSDPISIIFLLSVYSPPHHPLIIIMIPY